MSKLLVVFVVFLLVFKPQDLPHFVKFLTEIIAKINNFRQVMQNEWYKNLQKDIELEINNKKAQNIDLIYMRERNISFK